MTQKSIYRLIAQGGLDDWYNLITVSPTTSLVNSPLLFTL